MANKISRANYKQYTPCAGNVDHTGMNIISLEDFKKLLTLIVLLVKYLKCISQTLMVIYRGSIAFRHQVCFVCYYQPSNSI